jgi:hypothetical protein
MLGLSMFPETLCFVLHLLCCLFTTLAQNSKRSGMNERFSVVKHVVTTRGNNRCIHLL